MKNKNTKQMWIYAGILFIIAIALISITTITQWKLIPENGNLQVLNSFSQNSNQRIDQLTQENVDLKNKLDSVTKEYENAKASNEELVKQYELVNSDKNFIDASNKKLFSLLNAYLSNNKFSVKQQLANFSKEELEAVLPGFYDKANNMK